MTYYPKLREQIEVHKLKFERPRPELVELLGEDHQGCPVLVLADPTKAMELNLPVKEANGRVFIDDDRALGIYLSKVYGVSRPAHD